MKINVIIPTYNEAENIAKLVRDTSAIFRKNKVAGKIMIVDDNSPDGTGKIADKLSKEYKVEVLHREKKMGIGSAYIDGFKKALNGDADIIFEMDADFSHDPKCIPEFIKKINEGYDLVIGSRYIPGAGRENYPVHRTLISHGANYLIKLITRLPVVDVTTGYRAYKRSVLETIDLDSIKSKGYEFQLEILYRTHEAGFKIGKIPIIFAPRKRGASKLSFGDIKNFFILAFKLKLA